MLTLYRRHLKTCKHRGEGRAYTKCSCPIWCDGELNGNPDYRKSLKTRDWQRALRLAERLERPMSERDDLLPCAQPGCNERVERGRCGRHTRTLARAIAAYHEAHSDVSEGTGRNRRRRLRFLEEFTTGRGIATVDQVDLETLTTFRGARHGAYSALHRASDLGCGLAAEGSHPGR